LHATNEDSAAIPQTQHALQLIGPSQLKLNTAKDVHLPGPHQILAKVEAVGLCFSDLKLLKQFAEHPRKSQVVSGVGPDVLDSLPSYAPDDKPTVPGHEVVCDIVAIGEGVTRHEVGERVLVQADWRFVRTALTNGAFGYNFEGGLQEYVLFDERIVIDPQTQQRFLMPASRELSASAVCLVEPWGCVENSYVNAERNTIKPGGKLLVVAEAGHAIEGLIESFSPDGRPAEITAFCTEDVQRQSLTDAGLVFSEAESLASLPDEAFDDVVYFGAIKETLDVLNDKLAIRGIINIVTAGKRIGQPVSVGVGRIHYGLTRWIGTLETSAADAYKTIPPTGEIRSGDSVAIIGAAGPMGQMHTIRTLCLPMENMSVVATDMDDARLESLREKVQSLSDERGVPLRLVNTKTNPLDDRFSYFALMAPIGALVADAVVHSLPGCRINIFAGIPAPTRHDIDLDTYIANRCFMFGTSGSRIEDMQIVLDKVTAAQLDTDLSVDAICGMAGAADGIAAVENRTMAGKIIVYPQLHELPLIPLKELPAKLPAVAAKLNRGMWTKAAERELLKTANER